MKKQNKIALSFEFYKYLLNNPQELKKFNKENYVSITETNKILIKPTDSKKKKKHPKAGCMKGTFVMKEGFDDPLIEFNL